MDMTQLLLDWLVANGPLVLGMIALLTALGLPLPLPVMVLASGALVREGRLDPATAVLFCLLGSQLAETLGYVAGRLAGPRLEWQQGRFGFLWLRAEAHFSRHPCLTVYLTRFLLAPLAIPTNLLAGSTRFSYWRFVRSAIAGDAVWVALYGSVGYAVGQGWRNALAWMNVSARWLPILLATALLAAGLWHYRAAIPHLRSSLVLARVRRNHT